MTNHGVQDKVADFFVCHAVTEIDKVYWARRTEDLRKRYADRQQHLNPISLKQEYDLSKIEGMQAKIMELESRLEEISFKGSNSFETRIVETESELEDLARNGFECQIIAQGNWLMRRRSA